MQSSDLSDSAGPYNLCQHGEQMLNDDDDGNDVNGGLTEKEQL